MEKVTTHSLQETYTVATEMFQWLNSEMLGGYDNRDGATVLALYGDLGAGKTAFVQGLAKAAGIADTITSPTFVLMKIYEIPAGRSDRWRQLVHVDAYRFDKAEELQPLRWPELLRNKDNLIAIEWPERVAGALPVATVPIYFRFIDETTREITLPYD